eukprot:TRINITY_DN1356_c0_g2_i1.p1 TRINITY_DN1356_c0_g2~~TRINITY_DN1356_c0_g2_i1.p1  ORF type:complete len:284 (+),score=110.18 TRINITY_DN1356_c0_g2_i1:338-1189(+)
MNAVYNVQQQGTSVIVVHNGVVIGQLSPQQVSVNGQFMTFMNVQPQQPLPQAHQPLQLPPTPPTPQAQQPLLPSPTSEPVPYLNTTNLSILDECPKKTTYTHDPYAIYDEWNSTSTTSDQPEICPSDADKSVSACCGQKYRLVVAYRKYSRTETFYVDRPFEEGRVVAVPGDRGMDIGTVTTCSEVEDDDAGNKEVVRVRDATGDEVAEWKCLDVYEDKAREAVQQILNRNNISMTIHGAEYQYDKKKLTLYYRTSKNEAVRFRPVLGELYASFKCRIWFTKI